MHPDRPTLIYDGECGFCRQCVDAVRRWDREHRLTMIPFQDQARVAAFGIPLPALAAAMHLVRTDGRVFAGAAMHLVRTDGRVFAGADAAPEILRLVPGKRWLAWPFRIPGVLPIARRIYSWVARRRRCLVRGYAAD